MCRKRIVLFILILLLTTYASAFAGRPGRRSDDKAFKSIETLFLKGEYKKALSVCREFLKDFRKSGHKMEAMYIEALCYLKLGDFKNAKKAFDDLVNRSGGAVRQKAYIGLGDAYFLNDEYKSAIPVYEEFLRAYPKSDMKSLVYFKLAQAYEKTGKPDKANIYASKLEAEYSESPEKTISRGVFTDIKVTGSRKVDIPNEYSVQVGYFSSFSNAQELYQKLLKQRYTAFMQKENTPGGTFYRVRVGRFKSRRKAEKFAKKLKARGYQTRVYP